MEKKIFIKIATAYFLIFISFSCRVADRAPTPPVPEEEIEITVEENEEEPEIVKEEEEVKIYRASRTRKHDLIHTRLEVSFDWENRYLIGLANLELKPYFYPQSKLELDAKGFEIKEINLLWDVDKTPLEYQYDGEVVTISLDRKYNNQESYFLEISYIAKPYEYEAGGSSAIASDRGLYFINADGSDPNKPRQIWTQGETESNSRWFPTIDAPNERTSQEMYITVEENFTTLSNGILIYSQLNGDGTKTDYWKMELPHAPYLFMMAIGEFAIVKDSWNDLEVDYYVEPEYEPYAKAIFGNTPEMMTFFSEKLNYPFPWPKYSQVVVRDYVSGAMENTTASLYMEALQKTDRELLDENWDSIIAHELFHQWFGDLVTLESWANLPLNESFANYAEYLWNEYKYGIDEADFEGLNELTTYLTEAQEKQVDLIRFHYEEKEDMFDSHSYAKGGRVLHMLRKYVGDDAFFKSLELYLKTHEFSPVEIHNLRLAFEKITGEDLNWFFNQWFLASGHPQLKIENTHSGDSVFLRVVQGQDFETTPLYRLPLYVDIWTNNKKERFAIEVKLADETFKFYAPQKPDLVIFDAEKQLLAEIEYNLSNEELAFQYNNGEKFLSRFQSVSLLANDITDEKSRYVLIKALDDPFWGIRQAAINAFDDYEGPEQNQIKERMVSIIKNDPKSLVRADAISTLSSLDSLGYVDVYKAGMEDPSFAVVGASLFAYGQTNATDKMETFSKFEHLDNANVIIPIAGYYLEENLYEKYDWFHQKISKVDGADLYYILQYFGQFLMGAPQENKQEGAELLKDFALTHNAYYVRLAAFYSLSLIRDDVEGLTEEMREIIKVEKDPRLLQIYESF